MDYDSGEASDLYPKGTAYSSMFTGKFQNVVRLDSETYSMQIAEFNCDTNDGTWDIDDGLKDVKTDPYGMENASLFYVYLPGRYTNDLPEDFLSWASMLNAWSKIPETLPQWGLYNVGDKSGFICTKG